MVEKKTPLSAGDIPGAWPVVSPSEVGIPDYEFDLAYMGFFLRLAVCNFSPYLVREAELRVDGLGQGTQEIVTSRTIIVGPLLPHVYTPAEVGIGARGGIAGTRFDTVSVDAVRLTPPEEMVPASQYPALHAEVLAVEFHSNAPDRRCRDLPDDRLPSAERHTIRIGVQNEGPKVVERARLELTYFEITPESAGDQPSTRHVVANWILDMPRAGWDPYRLPSVTNVKLEPAEPLPPGQSYDFTLTHYGGGPCDWTRTREALSVVVREVKLS